MLNPHAIDGVITPPGRDAGVVSRQDKPPILRPYQQTGATWIAETLLKLREVTPRVGPVAALLGDDPGLGKTAQALAAGNELGARRTLIMAPAMGRYHYPPEIHKFIPHLTPFVRVVRHSDPIPDWLGASDLVVVIAYDTLGDTRSPWAAALAGEQWDLVIVDECHYLKNPSNRTKAVYGAEGKGGGIVANASYVILLSGTPTPNHAGEFWQHYRRFWSHLITVPMRIGGGRRPLNEPEWQERFTKFKETLFGRQIVGSRNQDQLRSALKPVILRRLKATVLKDLKPLTLVDRPVMPEDTAQRQLDTLSKLPRVRQMMSLSDDHLLVALQSQLKLADELPLATIRRSLGELKAPACAEHVREMLEGGVAKVLIFAWHVSVILALSKALADFMPVIISGTSSDTQRATAVNLFQSSPKHRVFIGNVLAAGTVITLTAAARVVMVEPSWVPGENIQAIARAHRMGQENPVLAEFLFVPGSLDEHIMGAFRRKSAETSQLYDESIS
jgi:SWI/SNF-related matrix-associated actin-dependent regulator of chromatin subfamily A-like protein 1